jgi:hypothetical protein
MSTTPAAELARLKLQWPLWAIGRTEGVGYLALGPGGERIETETLAELEQTLERLRRRPKERERK